MLSYKHGLLRATVQEWAPQPLVGPVPSIPGGFAAETKVDSVHPPAGEDTGSHLEAGRGESGLPQALWVSRQRPRSCFKASRRSRFSDEDLD